MAKFSNNPTGSITESGEAYRAINNLSKNDVRGLTDADVEGLVILADHTDAIIQAMGKAIARALEAVGIEAEGDAKELCPVDTGRLRNSITHIIDAGGDWAAIGTNVEYAEYVHNGTSRSKAQPFLTDAVTQNADKYRSITERMMKDA